MIDVKKEQIEVERLMLGMFVTELDRPWVGTPFLLQGFLLDDQADIDKLLILCQHVYIDRTKSIGNQFIAPTKHAVAIKREGAVMRVKDPSKITSDKDINKNTPINSQEKVTFLGILRDLKNYQSPENIATGGKIGTMYNVSSAQATRTGEVRSNQANTNIEQKSIAQHLVEDVGGLVTGFIGGFFNREKLRTSVEGAPKFEKARRVEQDDSYRITIYEEENPVENEISNIFPVYEQSQIATRSIFDAVASEQNLDLTAVSEILDNMVESIGRSPDALLWLAKLKSSDGHAYNHALNVSITIMAFANFLALSKNQIKELGLAGLLQDVGKAKISPDILLKKGKLTREEYEHAKKHVDESLKILEKTPNISPSVIFLASQHHERIDGSGYPNQLSESQLGLSAQIAGLIDTYCAITSNRSYAKGVYHQYALDELYSLGGKQFGADLVDQLVQFMGMYPVSSLVELNTGEVAVVIQQNQVRRLLPRLMLLLDNNKVRYGTPIVLNLLNSPSTPSGDAYRIVKSLEPDSYGLNPEDFYV
jgi:HD-GYP domain-containing protein (c-di-GMP phosphodiesterase class II)